MSRRVSVLSEWRANRSVLCSQFSIHNRRLIEARAGSERDDRCLHASLDPRHHTLTAGHEYKSSVESRAVRRKLTGSSGSEQVVQSLSNLHRRNGQYALLQLEPDENGSVFYIAELCSSIVVPIRRIPAFSPLGRHPHPVSSFGILYPPLLQCVS